MSIKATGQHASPLEWDRGYDVIESNSEWLWLEWDRAVSSFRPSAHEVPLIASGHVRCTTYVGQPTYAGGNDPLVLVGEHA